MRALLFAAASTTLFLAMGCGGKDAAPVTLRLRLTEGESYAFESVIKQTATGPVASEMNQKLVTTVTVKDATGGTYRTTSSISDVEVSGTGMGPAQQKQVIDQLKAVKIDLEYDDLGQSVSSKPAGDGAASQFAASMGAQGVGFLGLHFPSRPVKVGDKWNVEFDIKQVLGSMLANLKTKGETVIPIEYTLKSFAERSGKEVATIAFRMEGTVEFEVDRPGTPAAAVRLETKSAGEYVVDASTGIPLESTTTGNNTVVAGGQTIEQKMDIVVKYKG